jgi:hypothetical protein
LHLRLSIVRSIPACALRTIAVASPRPLLYVEFRHQQFQPVISPMHFRKDIIEAIGHTPLIQLWRA